MMRAAVLVAPGRFEIQDRAIPEPGRGEALVRTARVGICGTDLHIFEGRYAAESLPLVPGHEFAGTIAAVGADVTGLRVGGKAVVDMNIGCATCHWYRRNEILNCPEMVQLGITTDGAFAEYVAVPARLVIPAPADVPFAVLSLTEPLACVIRAACKARVRLGRSVVVLGAGPMGHLHVQLLRTMGAAPIVVFDISEDRVALARRHGADVGVSDPAALRGAVAEATAGRGADVVIERVGLGELYRTAMELIRKGGHVAAFGLAGPEDTLPLDILKTILEENSIKGSVAGMGQEMHDALAMLVHGRIDPTPFLGVEYPLADIQTAFETLSERREDLKTQIVMAREA